MANKIKWKNGASEVISFTVIVPFIVLLICAVLSAYIIGAANQQLMYAAYSVGRASVVCENLDLAENRADAIMEELYGDNFVGGDVYGSEKEKENDIKIGDSVTVANAGNTKYELEVIKSNGTWQKGTLIKCTVSQYVQSAMPFTSKIYSKSIVMMVENGQVITNDASIDEDG